MQWGFHRWWVHLWRLVSLELNLYFIMTLFNIVEVPYKKKLLNFDVCDVCMMIFRGTNKEPGIQKFWNLCCYHASIHLWLNITIQKPSGSWFILTLQSMGEISILFLVTCIFSLFWSTLIMMLLKCNFFRASFLHPITDTDSTQGHAAQILKSENIVKANV